MKLNELGKGETAMIDAFHLPFEIERRLLALGMTPGTTVNVVDRKGKGVMIVTVRGTRFAMGYNLTRNVDVTREVYHG